MDVLIGSDYYWYLVTGAVVPKEYGGPTAIHTKLEWVLSGLLEAPTSVPRIWSPPMSLESTSNLTPWITNWRHFGRLNYWECNWRRASCMMAPVVTSILEVHTKYNCLGSSFSNHYQITTTWASTDFVVFWSVYTRMLHSYNTTTASFTSRLRRVLWSKERFDYWDLHESPLEFALVHFFWIQLSGTSLNSTRTHILSWSRGLLTPSISMML